MRAKFIFTLVALVALAFAARPGLLYSGLRWSLVSASGRMILNGLHNCFELLEGRLYAHSDKSSSTWWPVSNGEVIVAYHPLSPHWYGSADVPFRFIQEAYDAINNGAGGYIYQSFEAIIKNDQGVDMGILALTFYPKSTRQASPASLPVSRPSLKFSTGVHYLPWNLTTHAAAPINNAKEPAPKLGAKPLGRCLRHDTIVAGSKLASGSKLYSANGNFVELQDDGNLCSTAFGKKNWCWMTNHPDGAKAGPFTMEIGKNGYFVFRDNKGGEYVSFGIGNYPAKNDGYFRLTMQNDGNLVFYYGSSNNSPVWATDKYVPGVEVTPPCTRHS